MKEYHHRLEDDEITISPQGNRTRFWVGRGLLEDCGNYEIIYETIKERPFQYRNLLVLAVQVVTNNLQIPSRIIVPGIITKYRFARDSLSDISLVEPLGKPLRGLLDLLSENRFKGPIHFW